jgi:hypothetical protein
MNKVYSTELSVGTSKMMCLRNGEKTYFVEFRANGGKLGLLYANTHQKSLQKLVEGSDKFKDGVIKLVSATQTDDDKNDEKSPVAGADTAPLEEIAGIVTLQDAAHYLAENYGLEISELKNKNIVKSRAKAQGICFPDLA